MFMNATALLFLNEFDDYVCSFLKQLLFKENEALFMVVPTNGMTSTHIDYSELYF